jgi:hypothetical protein
MFRKRPVPDKTPRCSFCRKVADAVGVLISSPCNDELFPAAEYFVYICSECVAVCNSLLDDRRRDKEGHGAAGGDPATLGDNASVTRPPK